MEISKVLLVQSPKGWDDPALVVAVGDRSIEIHGSTCDLSVPIASQDKGRCYPCNSFMVNRPKVNSMIALTVVSNLPKTGRQETDFMLSVTHTVGGKVYIDLDNQWVPKPDRVGGMSDHLLRVNIDGTWYTEFTSDENRKRSGERYVDGNTLCRYLAAEIDADAVIAAATAVEEEIAAKDRVPQLLIEIEDLKRRVESEQRENDEALVNVGRMMFYNANANNYLCDIATWYRELKTTVDVLMETAVGSRFYATERLHRACCSVSKRVDAFPQENLVGAPHQD